MFSGKVFRPLRVGPRQQPEAVEGPARLLLHQKLHHGGSASHAPQHESFEYFNNEHANQRKQVNIELVDMWGIPIAGDEITRN